MNAEQQAKNDYEQGRYREGFGIPDEYRDSYLEYSQYMEGVKDCEVGVYRRGMGSAYDGGFGNKYQMQEVICHG